MTNAFRAEWVRLLRPRTMLAAGLPLVLFPVAITVLAFAVATGAAVGGPAQHLTVTVDELAGKAGYLAGAEPAGTFIGVVVLVFFAVSFGADYTHGTLRNLLVREPGRGRLIAGRFLALWSFVAAGLVVAVVATMLASRVAAAGYDVSTARWSGFGVEAVKAWAALALAAVGWGSAGTLLATLLRNTTSAVAFGAVWALLVEPIMSEVWDGAARWFPGALFNATAAQGTTAVSLATAGTSAGLYAALAVGATVVAFSRRDVLV